MAELSPRLAEERARIDLLQELTAAVIAIAPPDVQPKLVTKAEAWEKAARAYAGHAKANGQ